MVLPDCLFDPISPLVIDASVVINLNATGYAAEILKAIPNQIAVTDMVTNELEAGRAKGRTDAERLADLVGSSHIERVALSPAAEGDFLDLVVGRGITTLDDGEAATIAWAVCHNGIPIIDDKKAVAICRQRYPGVKLGSTVDVLAQQTVLKQLGKAQVAEALYLALTVARMRVPDERMAWVVSAIGRDRVSSCLSLPERVRNAALDATPRDLMSKER